MPIPSRDELLASVDERFRAEHPDARDTLDDDDPAQAGFRAAWLAIRDELVNQWTNTAFYELFPGAPSRLDPDDPEHEAYIDYWLDIRDRIRDGAAPRFDLEAIALAGDAPPLVSSSVNPFVGTVWESTWDDGFAAGYDSPDASPQPPDDLEPGAVEVWETGVAAGQAQARADAASQPLDGTDGAFDTDVEANDEFGLPTIRVSFSQEQPIAGSIIDAGPALLAIDLRFSGNVSVEPPGSVQGISVDQTGYRAEVRNEIDGFISGLRINGIGNVVGDGPVSVGTTFGSEFVTNEVRQVAINRIVYIGQARLTGIVLATSHGDATLRGDLGMQVGFEIQPKTPVPVDEPWYVDTWEWVSDHAVEITLVGAALAAAVLITVVSDGAGAPAGAKIVQWAFKAAI